MYKNLSLLLIAILALLTSCDKGTENEELTIDPSFLLISSADPTGLPSDPALLIDARGPILFDLLNLTDEQKNAIKAVMDSIKEEYGDLRHNWCDMGLSWEEIEEQRELIHQEIDAAIQSILTGDQKAILISIETQFKNGEYPDELIQKHLGNLTDLLTLDTDQQLSIYSILDSFGTQLLELRSSADFEEFRQASHVLFTDLASAIRLELSDEQAVVFDSVLNSHKSRPPHHHNHH